MLLDVNVTPDSLEAIRRGMRFALHEHGVEVRMGHVAEAVAAALGSNTHASMLAQIKEAGPFSRRFCSCEFDLNVFVVRLALLANRALIDLVPAARNGVLGLVASHLMMASDEVWDEARVYLRALKARVPAGAALPYAYPGGVDAYRPAMYPDYHAPRIDWRETGRMMSTSRSGYAAAHPGHLLVFNAGLCVRSRGRIWHGDLDITQDAGQLHALAKELGEDLFVLRERDMPSDGDRSPSFELAVAVIGPDEIRLPGSMEVALPAPRL